MRHPRVSVIVPTYRRFDAVLRSVSDLLQQDYPSFEVLVVDQNPSWPSEYAERLATIRSDARVRWETLSVAGVVAARNHAVAKSDGDILVFVDDDVFVPSTHLLTSHVRNFENEAVVAVVGRERSPDDPPLNGAPAVPTSPEPLARPSHWSSLQQAMYFNRNGDAPQIVCTFSTCNGAIRRRAFLSVGGFDESFAGNSYGDDYDLALRLDRAGALIVYDPSAWLVHRRVPIGGLRLSDRTNKVDQVSTTAGLWLFLLRHGHRGMFGHLLFNHVLRKTVFLKRNLRQPWRQPLAWISLLRAFGVAYKSVARGPHSRFTTS